MPEPVDIVRRPFLTHLAELLLVVASAAGLVGWVLDTGWGLPVLAAAVTTIAICPWLPFISACLIAHGFEQPADAVASQSPEE